MEKKQKLSTRETAVLALLARGDNFEEVKSYLGITLNNIYVICGSIRRKMGIQTRDPEACQRLVSRLPKQQVEDALFPPAKPAPKAPTFCELDAFRALVRGHSYQSAAALLGIQSQSFQNLLSRGCKRAGIHHHGWDRNQRIRAWTMAHDGQTSADPMDDPMF
jgi:DNA-binding CsgD family transcriptional regulator